MRAGFGLGCLLALALGAAAHALSAPVEISLKNGTAREDRTRAQLTRLLETYDLSRWLFTDKVVVEAGVIPHSHPVLTLNTRYRQDDRLLSVFIHEQIHWHLDRDVARADRAIADLRALYPEVPVGGREGARSEYSSYLHLLVIYLEYRGMTDLVGPERARAVMEFMAGDHYTWIYATVLSDEAKIADVAARHDLAL